MKKLLFLFAAFALLASCSKKQPNSGNTVDKWNGYEKFYKEGEMYRDLIIKYHHEKVGTVTYGIDDDANFYVKYETDEGWELKSTKMFAGEWKHMSKRHRSHAKVMGFPYHNTFNPMVTTYTYTIPLTELPPAEEPGFIVAAQARVYNTNKCGGGHRYTYEEAWARWDRRFSCRTWGGYTNYYYNQPYEPHTLLYGTAYRNDSLVLYLLDATDNTSDLIASEYVGTPPSETYDGTAWDANNNHFFFTNYELQELWVNNMDSADSYKAGDLDGIAASATYYDGNFYYVDQNTNEIKEVVLAGTDSVYIASENTFSEIPSSIEVNDIAFEPNGDHIYIVGVYDSNVELMDLEVSTDTYSTITISGLSIDSNAQIAYGDDGNLYTVFSNDTGGSEIAQVHTETGVINPIDESGVEPVPDPFSDLAGGPGM